MNQTKKLNRQNNLLDGQIWAENQDIYVDMVCYIRGADISDYEIEMVRRDLIEMILSAQTRGDRLTALFPDGYQQFCDEVIAAIPPRTGKEKLLYRLDLVFGCLPVLMAVNLIATRDFIEIVKSLWAGAPVSWDISISLGSLLSMLVILLAAVLVVQRICKTSFQKQWNTRKLVAGGFVLGATSTAIFWVGKRVVFTVHLFGAVAVILLLLAVHMVLDRMEEST